MNGLYKVGATVYRGFVVTHWVFRRPGLLWRIAQVVLIVLGIVGIIAVWRGAHHSHRGSLAQLEARVTQLERACGPVDTGGGVVQCRQPSVYDTSAYSPGVLAWQGMLTEDDLQRVQHALKTLGEWVNGVAQGVAYMGCHVADRVETGDAAPLTWDTNLRRIRYCIAHMDDAQYDLASLHVTR